MAAFASLDYWLVVPMQAIQYVFAGKLPRRVTADDSPGRDIFVDASVCPYDRTL